MLQTYCPPENTSWLRPWLSLNVAVRKRPASYFFKPHQR